MIVRLNHREEFVCGVSAYEGLQTAQPLSRPEQHVLVEVYLLWIVVYTPF